MKIEEGKRYRDREGYEYGPMAPLKPRDDNYSYRCTSTGFMYTDSGRFFTTGTSMRDLVGEIFEPDSIESRLSRPEKLVQEHIAPKPEAKPVPKGGDPDEEIELLVTLTRREAQVYYDVLVRVFDVNDEIWDVLNHHIRGTSNAALRHIEERHLGNYLEALDKEMGWDSE